MCSRGRPSRLLAACLLAAIAAAVPAARAADSAIRQVEVTQSGESYVVDLAMWMPAPRELAFEVLTDFEHVARWTASVRESRVLQREPTRATVEYHGVVRLGGVAVPYATVRAVEFTAPTLIETTQIEGSMKRYRSRISLAVEGAGTRLDYHLELVPSGLGAALLNRARLEHEIRENFDGVAGEVLRRQRTAAPVAR